MPRDAEEGGVWAGSLVAQTPEGDCMWYFGPTMAVPFEEECIHCGDEWDPSCVFEFRDIAFSKQGRAFVDRLREADDSMTDIRHFADWTAEFDEQLHGTQGSDGVTYQKADGRADEMRFSGFDVLSMDTVAEYIDGQRYEGPADVTLSLLCHTISFGEVRTGELRSDPELMEGHEDVTWKCHRIMQNDFEGVLAQRARDARCMICARRLPATEDPVLGVACVDGECHNRLGDPRAGREGVQ